MLNKAIALVTALVLAALLAGAGIAVHQRSYLAGHEAGQVQGRIDMAKEVELVSNLEKQRQRAADAELERQAAEFKEKAQRELAALGRDAQRAKQELANYLKEKRSEQPEACGDPFGVHRIDGGIVRMLNAKRWETHHGGRAGAPADTQATARTDDAGPAPEAATWGDLAQGDLESTQSYLELAAKHERLIDWVNNFCSDHDNNKNKETAP